MSRKHFEDPALVRNPANYTSLSPLSIIKRTARLFGDKTAVVDGQRSFTWRQVYQRSIKLASALCNRGIKPGDTVSVLAPNIPELIEAHFGVPMAGAVLNTINIRLKKKTISYILEHSDCKLLIVDSSLVEMAHEVLSELKKPNSDIPLIRIDDHSDGMPERGQGERGQGITEQSVEQNVEESYDNFLAGGDENFNWKLPEDEWQAISLNYTSGTSGNPKGVIYHHRGSYLMTMGTVVAWQIPMHPVYLYTVPLFHCNGWGHIWTVCMMAGTLICCRQVNTKFIFEMVSKYQVTHFGGAPIVLGMLVNADPEEKKIITQYTRTKGNRVKLMTAGAPPPPAVLQETTRLGFDVMQVYGLTETYGHISHCLWKEEWDNLEESEQAEIKSWQGIAFPMTEEIGLLNLEGNNPEGNKLINQDEASEEEQGEIVIRSNTVMKGYYKDHEATKKAFKGGWFHSGDVAVWRDNGYMQVKDRLKDVIISGGENISSVEVENQLYRHPAVAYAAVVAMADEKWGEVPCAFVETKTDKTVSEEEIIEFCRKDMAGFKAPKKVVFGELPKTATGKIQKFILRDQIKNANSFPN